MRAALAALPLLAACATTSPPSLGPQGVADRMSETLDAVGAERNVEVRIALAEIGGGHLEVVTPGRVWLDWPTWQTLTPEQQRHVIAHATGHVLALGDGNPERRQRLARWVDELRPQPGRYGADKPDEIAAECAVALVDRRTDAEGACGELWRRIVADG